jgi:hypothetical protein
MGWNSSVKGVYTDSSTVLMIEAGGFGESEYLFMLRVEDFLLPDFSS